MVLCVIMLNQRTQLRKVDLVKHSVRTLTEILNKEDHLALIPFSNFARIELSLTKMTTNGKEKAIQKLSKLNPENATNIWDGLRVALDMVNNNPLCTRTNTSIILLSDGAENVYPPQGTIKTLQSYILEHPLTATINTFGYGYDLDGKLLNEIAKCGSGCWSYIPDCSMV